MAIALLDSEISEAKEIFPAEPVLSYPLTFGRNAQARKQGQFFLKISGAVRLHVVCEKSTEAVLMAMRQTVSLRGWSF